MGVVYAAPVGATLDGWTTDGTPVSLTEDGVTLWSRLGEVPDV